ncbi:MAG: hypothetical protein AB8V10_00380 [Francisella endosymbiont of Hyalomma asiaticum]
MKIIISIVKTSFVVIATFFRNISLSIKSVNIDNPSNVRPTKSIFLFWLLCFSSGKCLYISITVKQANSTCIKNAKRHDSAEIEAKILTQT